MGYFTFPDKVSLVELAKRIESTDLVPSRVGLLDDPQGKFDRISGEGIATLADLQKTLRNQGKMEALAKATGIDLQYLVLLRREIESYTPRPFKLIEVNWLPHAEIGRLIDAGIGNSTDLRDAAPDAAAQSALAEQTDVSLETVQRLYCLVDLARVQWVSLNFAHMLYEAGYPSAAAVAQADAEVLCERLEAVNAGGKYFNGKIGLRDIKRLIHSAGYVGE